MADLVIHFKHLALFVHRKNGLTVFFPTGSLGNEHDVRVYDSSGTHLSAYDDAGVELLADGKRLDVPTTPAPTDPVADVAALGMAVKPTVLSNSKVAGAVRWELGGGTLAPQTPIVAPGYGAVVGATWEWPSGHKQQLTNHSTLIVPLTAGVKYSLDFGAAGSIPFDSKTGLTLTVSNIDRDTGPEEAQFLLDGSLVEFSLLSAALSTNVDIPTIQGVFLAHIKSALKHWTHTHTTAGAAGAGGGGAAAFHYSEKPLCPQGQCGGPDR